MLTVQFIRASVLLILIVSAGIRAQGPAIEWVLTHGGDPYDHGHAVTETSDGGYAIIGETSVMGQFDLKLVRVDSAGTVLWTRDFGGAGYEYATAIEETSDGGLLVAASSNGFGNHFDIWLIRLRDDGTTLWTSVIGGTSYDAAYDLQETRDGGFIMVGATRSYGAGNNDIYLVRTDANGILLRHAWFGGPEPENGYAVQQTTDGGFVVAGAIDEFGTNSSLWVIRTDSLLNGVWSKSFTGAPNTGEVGLAIEQTVDGGFAVAGVTTDFSGPASTWLIRTDSLGVMIWENLYPGGVYDGTTEWGAIMDQTHDGGFILAQEYIASGTNNRDILITRTDAHGNILWTKIFGEPRSDYVGSIQQASDGGFVFVGRTWLSGGVQFDMWAVRLAPENGGTTPIVRALPNAIDGFTLAQNYPNPFNPSTTIRYHLSSPATVDLAIYDINGRRISQLVNAEQQVSGRQQVVWDGRTSAGRPVASGVYLYRLEVNGAAQIRRMVLVK